MRPINTNDFLEAMKEVPASLNQYANYQNKTQMSEYLTTQGHESVIAEIV